MRRGRPRKAGKRQPNGQIARTPARDKGCDGVQRRQAAYGAEGSGGQTFDAVGRAWCAKLLGKNADRKRDCARRVAAQYWRVYGFATPDSLARYQPSEGYGVSDPVADKIREDALNDTLDTLSKYGRGVRAAFDSLVIDINPDCGPAWLDRIIVARLGGQTPLERDGDTLRLAIIGLELFA